MLCMEIIKGSAKFILGFDKLEQIENWWAENPTAPGIAMVGRSNVGKSTLINALFGNKTAKTSKTPGRTQKINIFKFEIKGLEGIPFYLYDLPGYGFAEVSRSMRQNWNVIMDAYLRGLNDKTLIFNLQDARHPNLENDKQFYQYINPKEIEIFLIFNKMDKLKKQKERAALNKLKPQLYKEYKLVKQIFFVSADKKDGLEPLEQAITGYMDKFTKV